MKEFWKKKRKALLRNLKIEEISGVTQGDNPKAHVLFMKKKNPLTQPTKKETEMKLEDFLKQFKKVEETTEKTVETLAELQKSNEVLAKVADMSDAEKTFYKALPEDKREAFLDADADVRKEQMDEAEEAERIAKEKEEGKDDVTKAIDAATKPLEKALNEANSELKKLREERELADFEKSFDAELPHYGGSAEEKAELLKSLKAMDETVRKNVMAELKKADEIKKTYFVEAGTAARGSDDPLVKLEALANKRSEEKDISYAKAYQEVLKTAEGSALYDASQKQ